jgi:hypothetical protein
MAPSGKVSRTSPTPNHDSQPPIVRDQDRTGVYFKKGGGVYICNYRTSEPWGQHVPPSYHIPPFDINYKNWKETECAPIASIHICIIYICRTVHTPQSSIPFFIRLQNLDRGLARVVVVSFTLVVGARGGRHSIQNDIWLAMPPQVQEEILLG